MKQIESEQTTQVELFDPKIDHSFISHGDDQPKHGDHPGFSFQHMGLNILSANVAGLHASYTSQPEGLNPKTNNGMHINERYVYSGNINELENKGKPYYQQEDGVIYVAKAKGAISGVPFTTEDIQNLPTYAHRLEKIRAAIVNAAKEQDIVVIQEMPHPSLPESDNFYQELRAQLPDFTIDPKRFFVDKTGEVGMFTLYKTDSFARVIDETEDYKSFNSLAKSNEAQIVAFHMPGGQVHHIANIHGPFVKEKVVMDNWERYLESLNQFQNLGVSVMGDSNIDVELSSELHFSGARRIGFSVPGEEKLFPHDTLDIFLGFPSLPQDDYEDKLSLIKKIADQKVVSQSEEPITIEKLNKYGAAPSDSIQLLFASHAEAVRFFQQSEARKLKLGIVIEGIKALPKGMAEEHGPIYALVLKPEAWQEAQKELNLQINRHVLLKPRKIDLNKIALSDSGDKIKIYFDTKQSADEFARDAFLEAGLGNAFGSGPGSVKQNESSSNFFVSVANTANKNLEKAKDEISGLSFITVQGASMREQLYTSLYDALSSKKMPPKRQGCEQERKSTTSKVARP